MRREVDWAEIVDMFASEYGWTIEDIKQLDLGQLVALSRAIINRRRQMIGKPPIVETAPGYEGPTKEEMIAFLRAMGTPEKEIKDGKKVFKI